MQSVIRVIAIAYLIFITVLLLTSDPTRLVDFNGWLMSLLRALAPWAHLLSFLTLSVLVLAARWPAPRWCVVLLLVFYATIVELAQSLVPKRTVEWNDWLFNMVGIAAAVVFCWTASTLAGAIASRRRRRYSALPADEWEIFYMAMSRPNAETRSWWG